MQLKATCTWFNKKQPNDKNITYTCVFVPKFNNLSQQYNETSTITMRIARI